ncbi:MAG: PAS domain-containing sensor histidine kinase [Puia sp.]|nr:PAS domain-containing sensor histidine kinase [Puia sp.]
MPEADNVYKGAVGDNIDARQYEALFNNAIVGIVLTDQAGEIIHMNRFAENQFGYKRDELVGKPVELLIPRKFRGKHEGYREHFYRHPQTRTMGEGRDLHALCKDGSEFPAEVSLSHYELEGRNFVIAFIVDITVRKNGELLLLKQKEELQRVSSEVRQLNLELEKKVSDRTLMLQEALQALKKSQEELNLAYEKEKELGILKSRFVSMASHEFRTPLSTILSSISLVKRYSTPEGLHNQGRHIEKIQNAVRNLNYVIDDFLSLGKLEEGLVEVNIESFSTQIFLADIDDLLQELNQSSRKDQRIGLSHMIQDEFITADRKLLRNILMNLVSNAIKYSPEKSVITIHCNCEPGELQISVSDQGIGISEEDQQHLFERFFRANNVTGIQGTGLGLHIVGRYLDLMGGRITLNSRINQGTTFTLYIPQPGRDHL